MRSIVKVSGFRPTVANSLGMGVETLEFENLLSTHFIVSNADVGFGNIL